MEELERCPFCGSDAELDFADKSFAYTDSNGNAMETGFFYTVKCRDEFCGCRIGIYEDPRMAISAWNRRTANEQT